MTRRQTARKAVVEQFLISIALDPDANLHCYLMTDDKRYISAAADKMLSEAEKLGCAHPPMGLMLATPITADVAAVREIIGKRNAKVEQLFASATDFHWSFFVTCAGDPDDAKLMAMH